MNTYPNLNEYEATLLKIKSKDDQLEEQQCKTKKQYYENISKPPKIDNEYFEKKYKSLNKKKIFPIVSEILLGIGGLSVGNGLTISGIPPAGMVTAGSISFLSSISTLITNEYFSK